jgi:cytochrome d ubiquinol oxidase subunit II
MNTFAFCLLGFMLAMYVLLDGYDLGVETFLGIVARSPAERDAATATVRPFRDGNEVWLIAAGGALFALFPKAYASAFSGFYLPFMVVLWLLMFRGIAMELRNHYSAPIWHDFWDVCFAGSSALLAVLFGVALGNLIRGLPLDAGGYFVGTFGFLLNPFALLVGLLALCALAAHGALYLKMRTAGPPAERARLAARWLIPLNAALYAIATIATFFLVPTSVHAWWAVFPLLSLAALACAYIFDRRDRATGAFGASCLYLVTLLAAAAAALYPYLVPGFPQRTTGLSIDASAPSPVALISALVAIVVGLCVVIAYRTGVVRALTRPLAERSQ